MITILGLDVSLTNTGWATIDTNGDTLNSGNIIPPRKGTLEERTKFIHDELIKLIKSEKPTTAALEDFPRGFGKASSPQTIASLWVAQMAARWALISQSVPYSAAHVSTIRAALKPWLGLSSRPTKNDVQAALFPSDGDIADALAAAHWLRLKKD